MVKQGGKGGKGKGKEGAISHFSGYCSHCNKWGHRRRACRAYDKVMEEYRASKGGAKGAQGKGGKGLAPMQEIFEGLENILALTQNPSGAREVNERRKGLSYKQALVGPPGLKSVALSNRYQCLAQDEGDVQRLCPHHARPSSRTSQRGE